MDFLRNHTPRRGGYTSRHPNTPNLANHGIRQEGKGPPHTNPFQSTKSRQTLPILSNTNTLCPVHLTSSLLSTAFSHECNNAQKTTTQSILVSDTKTSYSRSILKVFIVMRWP